MTPVADSYNAVLLKNPMSEDFVFGYDNRRDQADYMEEGNYIIKAGEVRAFPKFIARIAMKHLIDRILMKKDVQGKLINNQNERDKIAAIVLVREEKYDKPYIPTDKQIVDEMGTDMERLLAKQSTRLAEEATQPEAREVAEVKNDEEEFEGLKEVKPKTREELYSYAVNSLKLDLEAVVDNKGGKPRTAKQVWDKMTVEQLVTEFQLGE